MNITTTKFSKLVHRDFHICCDDSIPIADVEWLVSTLYSRVVAGEVFQAGETIQVGWMLVLASTRANGLLLREPDLQSLPITWIDGITNTLRHLRLQKDAVDSFGLIESMHFPSLRQSAIVGVDMSNCVQEFIMERLNPTDNDSGWFLGDLRSNVDYSQPMNLRRVSLYEAFLMCPQCVMFLAFPTGTKVERNRQGVQVSLDGKVVHPTRDSFFDRLDQ